MELSLVESEMNGRSSDESEAGPSRGRFEMFEDDSSPNSGRVSSYDPSTRNEAAAYGQVASDPGAAGSMPGSWRIQQMTSSSLMDDEDNLASLPALTPTKTGAKLQSKNPFLSRQERQVESQLESESISTPRMSSPLTPTAYSHPVPGLGSMGHLSPASASRPVPASPRRASPGSAYTTYTPDSRPPYSPSEKQRYSQQSDVSARVIALPPRVNAASSVLPRQRPASDSFPFQGDSSRPLPQPPSRGSLAYGSAESVGREDPLGLLKEFDTVFLGTFRLWISMHANPRR